MTGLIVQVREIWEVVAMYEAVKPSESYMPERDIGLDANSSIWSAFFLPTGFLFTTSFISI